VPGRCFQFTNEHCYNCGRPPDGRYGSCDVYKYGLNTSVYEAHHPVNNAIAHTVFRKPVDRRAAEIIYEILLQMKAALQSLPMMRTPVLFVVLLTVCSPLFAQTNITMKQALDSALKRSPSVQAAALQAVQSRQLQKSSVSIPNTEVLAESPTGEFYTLGVQQSFDFPGTYVRQFQYQKEQTRLAGFGQAISQLEVKREVARLYLDIQYQQARLSLLAKQDSVYQLINTAAARQFDAGKLDYIQKTFAEVQYGEIHMRFAQAQADYAAAQEQLAVLTGIAPPFTVDSLTAAVAQDKVQPVLSANPYIAFYEQQKMVNHRLLQVERSRFLPGITVGYLNQGPLSTPVGFRFRAGITVPLWFWQYTARIQAAKTGMRIAEFQSAAQTQQMSVQLIGARAAQARSVAALIYYEESGLKNAAGIEHAAGRFFNAGETDHMTYLRTLNETYTIRFNHLDAVKNYNESVLQLNYLSGNL
jgi:outer membrane protein TolC